MKQGTTEKVKFRKLKRRLGIHEWQCIGLLESIWRLTASSAPEGDIGKLTNEDIAASIEYEDDADEMIKQLVECGWLDEDDRFRLVVHDWQDHAPNFVKGHIKRYGREFAVASTKDGAKQPSKHGAKQPTKEVAKDTAKDNAREYATQSSLVQSSQAKPTTKNAASQPRVSYPELFEQFWTEYPANSRGRKRGKEASFQLWKKIPDDLLDDLMRATKIYAKEATTHVRDPERFLRNNWWHDLLAEHERAPMETF